MKIFLFFIFFVFNFASGFQAPQVRLPSLSLRKLLSSPSSSSELQNHTPAPLLVRAYRGEPVERVPIWLMRQAGRYMKDFRQYSERYKFRERSETPEIATELSLQPWRSFGVDGVIMFSDILTPLPAMGIEFDIMEGKGPKITNPLRKAEDIKDLDLKKLSFVGQTLQNLRQKLPADTALIGFIGAPWTLLGYAMEGSHSKLCKTTKLFCLENPEEAHRVLSRLTDFLCQYATYQIQNGAQIMQVFESWAHHMSEEIFEQFGLPYANKISEYLKKHHPEVPSVYFANGGSLFTTQQKASSFSALSFDWRYDLSTIRRLVGPDRVIAGNLDPVVLYGFTEDKNQDQSKGQGGKLTLKRQVERVLEASGGKKFVFNLGHGVEKDIEEGAVRELVNIVHNFPIPK